MSDGIITDEELAETASDDTYLAEQYWKREKALEFAVQARVPNAGHDEILLSAKAFEAYLTGKTDE